MQYIDILFLIVTLGVGFILYTRLGKRTGHEKSFMHPMTDSIKIVGSNHQAKIVLSSLEADLEGIAAIQKHDKKFSVDDFLDKVRGAFEKIVRAFLGGDKAMLEALFTPQFYKLYKEELLALEKKKIKTDLEFFRLVSAEVKDVQATGSDAEIKVHFVSEQTQVRRNEKGKIVDGDANFIDRISEMWTFSRKLKSRGPWMLSGISPYEAT